MVLLTPGLSVIIDALKESRKIFRRMTSYAIYRISETIRVLLFMTFSFLVFNFYPVTAVPASLRWLMQYNPLAVLISSYREALMQGNWPDPLALVVLLAAGVLLLVAGLEIFDRGRRGFVDAF